MRRHLVSGTRAPGIVRHVALVVLLAMVPMASRVQERAPPPARVNALEERQWVAHLVVTNRVEKALDTMESQAAAGKLPE